MPSHATTTVAGYLARRLTDAGVRSVFATGGGDDPVLPRAITAHRELTWIETTTKQAAPQAASQLTGQFDLPAEVAAAGIDRMLAAALRSGGPVYLSIPAGVAVAPVPVPAGPLPAESPDSGPLSWASVWPAVQGFLAPGDVLVAGQGALGEAASLTLPDGVQLIAASCPAPAGWVGPAALGASLAAPDRRVIVLSGEHGPARAAGLGTLLAQGLAPVMIWAGQDGAPIPVPAPAAATGAAAVTTEVTSRPALTTALRQAARQAEAGYLVLIQAILARPALPARTPRAAA